MAPRLSWWRANPPEGPGSFCTEVGKRCPGDRFAIFLHEVACVGNLDRLGAPSNDAAEFLHDSLA